MKKTKNDPVVDEVRQIRRSISKRFDHDPAKLVAYYLQVQEKYRDRLVVSVARRRHTARSR
jgi:hypothetical protein